VRIAWDNLLKTATLSATNEDANYPVENLYHKWARLKFEAGTTSTVITASWAADVTVSAIGISYHNLSAISVVLKNAAAATLDTWTPPVTYQTDLYVDTAETTVRSVEVTLTSATDLYLGSLFIGAYDQYNKSAGQDIPLKSTAAVTKSIGGQVAGRTGITLRGGNISIPDLTVAERKQLEDMYDELQEVYPFWLDLWHSSHASFTPVYGHMTSGLRIEKDEWQDTTASFDFEEAR